MQGLFNIIIILIGFFVLYYLLKKEIEKIYSDKAFDITNKITNQLFENFNLLKSEVDKHLSQTVEKQEKIIETTSKIEEVARTLESSKEEIKSFKEIFAGPKSRGYLGEIMIEEILKNLPNSFYEKQYPIGNERVDYVLKLNETLIPIDAKFPVQNFQNILNQNEKQNIKKELIRNLKNKIDDISRKYILPSKGTVEFVIMYLANEAIYYELLSDKDYDEVWDFAREKYVFISSPKTFELMCSSLLQIIRKQQIGENIQLILNNLHQLEKDLIELGESFEKSYKQLKYSFDNLQQFERILNRFIFNYRQLVKKETQLEEKIKEKTLI